MNTLSISKAWDETAEFAKREMGAVFPIALALIMLPSILLQVLGSMLITPGSTSGTLPQLLMVLIVLALDIVGTIAISALAIGRESVVGSAIRRGFRRLPAMLGAALLVALASVVILTIIAALVGVQVEDLQSSPPPESAIGKLALMGLIFLAIALVFWAKLMLMTPVAAAEEGGPIAIIRRSWRLTAGHFLKLLVFSILMLVVLVVVSVAVNAVFGTLLRVVDDPLKPGTIANLLLLVICGVVNAGLVVLFTTMTSRIYARLAGPATNGI
jgi:hypothetical protein